MAGLGHLAVQHAKKAGFRTVAISRSSDKEKLARQLGAHHYIDSEKEEPAQALQALVGAISSLTNGFGSDSELIIAAGSGEQLELSAMDFLKGQIRLEVHLLAKQRNSKKPLN